MVTAAPTDPPISSITTNTPINPAAHPALNLGLLTNHLFTAILWADDEGRIQWVNTQAEQLFSASQARLMGRSILEILSPASPQAAPEQAQLAAFDTTAQLGHLSPKIYTTPSSGHRSAPNNSQAPSFSDPQATLKAQLNHALSYQQPFIDHDQLIVGLCHNLLVDYSVTPVDHQDRSYFLIEIWEKNRQSRISQEQRQQKQHAIARQMLRALAHEIKNPLAGIRGAAQLLNKHFSKLGINEEKIHTYSGIIISETDRLTQLIGQMLGSNRPANWQSVNIHQPLEHVLTLTHSQYPNIVIQRDYDLSLPQLTADKDQLIQVFLNLLNNACQAMLEPAPTLSQSGGLNTDDDYIPTICIQTRVAFQHTIGSVQHKQVLKVSIQDNGSGIDPDMIGQIFLPLVTGRATGSGLGLALVQDIITRHHGAIDVISSLGNTTFTVYLPFHQQN